MKQVEQLETQILLDCMALGNLSRQDLADRLKCSYSLIAKILGGHKTFTQDMYHRASCLYSELIDEKEQRLIDLKEIYK